MPIASRLEPRRSTSLCDTEDPVDSRHLRESTHSDSSAPVLDKYEERRFNQQGFSISYSHKTHYYLTNQTTLYVGYYTLSLHSPLLIHDCFEALPIHSTINVKMTSIGYQNRYITGLLTLRIMSTLTSAGK